MTKRLLPLLLMLLLASCAAELPQNDWCYQFDFRTSDYGFTLNYGIYTPGAGFTPDDQGRFAILYTYSETVAPYAAIVSVARADENQIPIKVIAKADIFGMSSGTLETTVPPDVRYVDMVLRQPGQSDKLEFTGEATRTIVLWSLQIRGNGSNPFLSSNCSTDAIVPPAPPIQIPIQDIIGALQQANQQLADIDAPLTAPNGSPLLPNETGARLFGYAKWLISPATADELLGPFSPILSHFGIFLALDVALVSIYFVVFAATYLIRWVIWLFRLILQIIQAIVSAANGIAGWLLAFIGL